MTMLNQFEKRVSEIGYTGLHSREIEILQVNLGFRCNQECTHCHLGAGPQRKEMMDWSVMEMIFHVAKKVPCRLMDITGGAPELNPHFRRFVTALDGAGHRIQVRTNLTILLEPEFEDLPEFFRKHEIQLVASLPCYLEENVCAQRGQGVYPRSIEAIKRLNAVGYGSKPPLALNLVYNPRGPFLPPPQPMLEQDYKRELSTRFGITFTRLLTITNMALGRFGQELRRQNQERAYLHLLQESFNPETVTRLMCRYQVNVGWDGTLYDCDFNLALGLPVDHGAPDHIRSFEPDDLQERRIVTGEHCFACTAGAGSSCGGVLVPLSEES